MRAAGARDVGLDPAAVAAAVNYAATHNRLSVKIFRHGCLVASGPLDAVTERVPWNVWSSTKGVISLLAGIAEGDGSLRLDDPIGDYLPDGLGDAEHRAITIRQLLTESSGLEEAILAEAATMGAEADVVRQAMALPLDASPGSRFRYSQRTADLLAYVVERAVGQDLQEFAQQRLFDPLGIPPTSYFWLRDRAGHTYGYANLYLAPERFARLGLLLGNAGRWRDRQVVPADYVARLARPTSTNACYGFLVWTNAGDTCTTASIPSVRTLDHPMVPSAPRDMFAMVGAFQQNNFVLPSLDMVVTWTGLGGDTAPGPQALLSANPGADLYHEFFRILLRGVQDRQMADPGPYPADGPNLDLDPMNYLDPLVLGNGLGVGPYAPPGCTLLYCLGSDPVAGPREVVPDIIAAALGVAGVPPG